jgi:tetratricopeptide (TPR) repeat protein
MSPRMNRLLLLAAALLLILPIGLPAEDLSIVLTEDVQLKVADAFMAEGEYYRAVTEYKKFIILFPGSKKTDYALYGIGLAYYHGDEFEQAARIFASIGTGYPGSHYVPAALYQEGISHWRLGRPEKAAEAFEKTVAAGPDSTYARQAVMGKSLAEFDLDNMAGCRQELERFIASYPQDAKTGQVREAITLLDRHRELPEKSPLPYLCRSHGRRDHRLFSQRTFHRRDDRGTPSGKLCRSRSRRGHWTAFLHRQYLWRRQCRDKVHDRCEKGLAGKDRPFS